MISDCFSRIQAGLSLQANGEVKGLGRVQSLWKCLGSWARIAASPKLQR